MRQPARRFAWRQAVISFPTSSTSTSCSNCWVLRSLPHRPRPISRWSLSVPRRERGKSLAYPHTAFQNSRSRSPFRFNDLKPYVANGSAPHGKNSIMMKFLQGRSNHIPPDSGGSESQVSRESQSLPSEDGRDMLSRKGRSGDGFLTAGFSPDDESTLDATCGLAVPIKPSVHRRHPKRCLHLPRWGRTRNRA